MQTAVPHWMILLAANMKPDHNVSPCGVQCAAMIYFHVQYLCFLANSIFVMSFFITEDGFRTNKM